MKFKFGTVITIFSLVACGGGGGGEMTYNNEKDLHSIINLFKILKNNFKELEQEIKILERILKKKL